MIRQKYWLTKTELSEPIQLKKTGVKKESLADKITELTFQTKEAIISLRKG